MSKTFWCPRWTVLFSVVSCLVCADRGALSADAADWPRFRGPNGTGQSSAAGIPVEIGEESNRLWKIELPGAGNSSPVVADGRIYLQTSSSDGSERRLLCIDLQSGRTLWTRSAPGGPGVTHRKNTLASCTGAVADGRVFMPFWDGKRLTVSAYEIDGHPLWTTDLGEFTSQHGAGHSPIVVDDHVIIMNDQDGLAEVVALEARTGAVAWKTPRHAFRASYATPVVIERAGHGPEVVVASTDGVAGYDPKTGTECWKWIWASNKQELRTVASPVVCNDQLFFSGGNGPGARHAVAINLKGKESDDTPHFAWETLKDFPYVPCLLSRGDNVYFINDSGVAGGFHAATGRRLWLERLPGGDVTASPVMIEDRIYAFTENGATFVFAADTQFKLLAEGKLAEGVKASPAVADGRLIVRGEKSLYCFGRPTPAQ
ncbi:MAG: PQQ-binding-like beta-propeller repeat protein [Planctomycetes bacterium]|nr:PQQ-binding-like beta-propeller repeat protein [Planctomycetota bacterium]